MKKLLTVYIVTTIVMVLCVLTSAYSMVNQYRLYGFEYVKKVEIDGFVYSETVNLGSLFIGFLVVVWLTCICYRIYRLEKMYETIQNEVENTVNQ